MRRMKNEAFAARVVVEVILFLVVEVFRVDVFGMSRGLPETVGAVISRSRG